MGPLLNADSRHWPETLHLCGQDSLRRCGEGAQKNSFCGCLNFVLVRCYCGCIVLFSRNFETFIIPLCFYKTTSVGDAVEGHFQIPLIAQCYYKIFKITLNFRVHFLAAHQSRLRIR